MNLTYQPVSTDADIAAVRRMADAIWPPTFSPILPPDQIPYMMRMMYDAPVIRAELGAGVRWELVLLDGEPAGYLSWGPYPPPGRPGAAKLHKVYLLPALHSRGIGQAMLAHALDACRADGYSRVFLAVNKRNDRAIRAYKRHGFAVAESVVADIGSGFVMDDYLMVFDLAAAPAAQPVLATLSPRVRRLVVVLNTVGFALFLLWLFSLRDHAILREQEGILYYLPCLPFLFVYLLFLPRAPAAPGRPGQNASPADASRRDSSASTRASSLSPADSNVAENRK
ncbi:MAG: GNAT family N-acetyltransferase [Kiritimatiellae bacterium]|nr:GNAT family N-acetyltransferase [Kiritimatiellia bacterium]